MRLEDLVLELGADLDSGHEDKAKYEVVVLDVTGETGQIASVMWDYQEEKVVIELE